MKAGKFVAGCGVTVFAVVWIGGWTTGTLFFDYMLVSGAVKQYQTRSFKETTGTILESTTESVRDSDGTSTKLKMRYSFRVKGRDYEGKDASFGVPTIGSTYTESLAAKYKPGQQVKVYYDADKPSSAVLERGLNLEDVAALLFMAMFLTPFNLVMAASWGVAYFAVFKRKQRDPPNGVSLWENPAALHIRMKHTPAWSAALLAMGCSAIVMVFAVVGGIALLKTTLVSFAGWAVVVIVMAIAYRWQQRKIESGLFDVVVDGAKGEITIPPAGLKRGYAVVPYGELYGVTVEKDIRSDSDGDDASVYIPTLLHGELQRTPVLEDRDEEAATIFAEWFAKKLKTEFKTSTV